MPNREINPLEFLNIPRYIMQWLNGRRMDKYIGDELDKRFQEYKRNRVSPSSKSVIDLVLQAYFAEQPKNSSDESFENDKLDPRFREFAITQVRLFLFVGHDSMSSTICYAIHLLSTNPKALATIRDEHDSVFGRTLSDVPSLLKGQPQLLNALPYTTAVIKETLRMFPPGSGIRQGCAGVDLIAKNGTRYPTANTLIWILHTAMHRAPEYWVEPDAFLPERWLVGPDDRLYPQKGAWRPFEWGPRNCIGQSLAMMELRITLAMVAREFDFTPGYDEWDRIYPRKGVQTYRGERAYQIEEAAAHPADRYPCRIRIAGGANGHA
jgi:Cytochrome P450